MSFQTSPFICVSSAGFSEWHAAFPKDTAMLPSHVAFRCARPPPATQAGLHAPPRMRASLWFESHDGDAGERRSWALRDTSHVYTVH